MNLFRHWAPTLAALVLSACAGATSVTPMAGSTAGGWSPAAAAVRPVNLGWPGGARLQDNVRFAGGVELVLAEDSRLHSLSDLKLLDDGSFISVSDAHKSQVAEVARRFVELGFDLVSTSGTASVLEAAGLKVRRIPKLNEGRPHAVDLLKNKEIQFVINTPSGANPRADEVKIRSTAVMTGTPIMTTLSGARAAALGIAALQKQGYSVRTVQEYH